MQVHVLDKNQNFIAELLLLEETMSSLFGINLEKSVEREKDA